MIKKALAVGIVLLFMVSSFIPMVTATTMSKSCEFYWGPILDAKLDVVIYGQDNGSFWSVVHEIVYFVKGIGRHDIYWEVEYEIYVLDMNTSQPMLISGKVSGNDTLYFFQPNKDPMWKFKASGDTYIGPHDYFLECTLNGTLIIDDKVWSDFSYHWEWE